MSPLPSSSSLLSLLSPRSDDFSNVTNVHDMMMNPVQHYSPGDVTGSGFDGPATGFGYQYHLHARLIGGNRVDRADDLAPAAIVASVFFLLPIGCYFRNRKEEWKTNLWWYLFAASALMGLGFAIRAGIADTRIGDVSKGAVIINQIILVTAHTGLLDITTTLVRDLMFAAHPAETSGHRYQTLVCRVIFPVMLLLQIIGLTKLPSPPSTLPPSSTSTSLRVAGSGINFLLHLGNSIWAVFGRCFFPDMRTLEWLHCVLCCFLLAVPGFYNFVIVAVTVDDSPLVRHNLFFYLSFGLCHILYIVALLALDLNMSYGARMRRYVIL